MRFTLDSLALAAGCKLLSKVEMPARGSHQHELSVPRALQGKYSDEELYRHYEGALIQRSARLVGTTAAFDASFLIGWNHRREKSRSII